MKHFYYLLLVIFFNVGIYNPAFAADLIDLSEYGNANCYIISKSGNYSFSVNDYPTAKKAFILWNENGKNDITDVRLENRYVIFSKPLFSKGNAVISIADEQNVILWSWHIWSTDEPKYYKKNKYMIMDRNLGATSSDSRNPDSYGLSYNPGNPFPFPGPKYSDFKITQSPSVPNGWYVADGYGFYADSKMPTPDKPMLLCSHSDKFGNSEYFRKGFNQLPGTYYLPYAEEFIDVIGYEPVVKDNMLVTDFGLTLPCINSNKINDYLGAYLCYGIYNTTAVDTWIVTFRNDVAKKSYCTGAALMPIRGFLKWVEPYSLEFESSKISISIGDEAIIKPIFYPRNPTDKTLNWSSSHENIVSVSNGVIKGLARGTAVVTATTASGLSAQCTVTVNPILVEKIDLTPSSIEALEGTSIQFKTNIEPENATDKTLAWHTDNPKVATVDGNGMLNIISQGDAVITVSAMDGSNVSAQCFVSGLSGIGVILSDNEKYDIFDINGILLKRSIDKEDINNLSRGFYIIKSKNQCFKVFMNR